ncbi:MAG: Crp/Fnr family transcriptional regulator [Saprospiraceae bacterium]|nr:Crp/Fnr family transcriptional regulator [Lewinella sp.]
MHHLEIFRFLDHLHPLTVEARSDLETLLQSQETDKNDYLLREGDRAHYIYWLQEGVVRVFYSQDGNEYNKTFFVPGMFPTPITALLSDSPSQLSFQALTPAQLVRFSYRKFRSMFDKHRCLESLMLRIMEIQWIKKERHDIRMVMNDATTNYLTFREEYPDLEHLIPQYHIASYLGITPIQLSRIRAKLAQGV